MITSIDQLSPDKTYTYADYLTWRFDGLVELIKGKVFNMSPAPTSKHQILSGNLQREISVYLKGKKCKVFAAPFDVRLPKQGTSSLSDKEVYTVVQPDLCVICDLEKIDERGCKGAPDLVMEILSKNTSQKDLKDKYEVYEQSGVKEYWVIHPYEATALVYKLDSEGKYVAGRLLTMSDTLTTDILPGLVVSLAEVFED